MAARRRSAGRDRRADGDAQSRRPGHNSQFDEIPSSTVRNYQLKWELRDDDNTLVAIDSKALPEIGPPQSLAASWATTTSKPLRLRMCVFRPTGFVAAEKTLDWWNPRAGGLNIEQMKRRGITVPE